MPAGTLPPLGKYSHAIRAGDFLFVTGHLAEDPQTGEVVAGPIDQQVRQHTKKLVISGKSRPIGG